MGTLLVIEGIHGLSGEYETDFSFFTNREWRTIKEIAGVRMGEFQTAMDAGDNDLIVALTVIALRRRNIDVNVDALWDAEAGKITMRTDELEDDALPPVSEPAENANASGPGPSSAPLSAVSGDGGPETTLAATGTQG